MVAALTKNRTDLFSTENKSVLFSAPAYAEHLLTSLGFPATRRVLHEEEHPALAWARSGLMALTGPRDGAPQMCPVPLASCADGALAALASIAPAGTLDGLRGSLLLAERAAIAGYSRRGPASPGGSCRLLEAADGWIALTLARQDDWALLPAWLERDGAYDWDAVARTVRFKAAQELVERGRLIGLAVAADAVASSPRRKPGSSVFKTLDAGVRRHDDGDGAASRIAPMGRSYNGHDGRPPLVIDLSSLWAGPLCGHLLQRVGAEVVKVESTTRPDGARQGPPVFFDLMNAGKASVALDFGTARGREQLQALLRKADIVIEGSRPRALHQLGIDAEALVREQPGLTWISITGYGRGEPQENWVAYGDDAAVAAGLSHVLHQATGHRLICADAIADPLTGLHAALAAWANYCSGGGRLISIALRDVVSHCIGFDLPGSTAGLRARQAAWTGTAEAAGCPAARPRTRVPGGSARPFGADTAAVLARCGVS